MALARVAQVKEAMGDRQWTVTARTNAVPMAEGRAQ
jgi:hypothetical protein